jgi:hypothetical protein
MPAKKPDKVVNAIAAALDAGKIEAVPVSGGSVPVPLGQAAALWLIPWMCEPEVRVGARITPPKARKAKPLYATWGDTRHALDILRELSAALSPLDSGVLEFVAVSSAEMNDLLAGDDDDDAEGEDEEEEEDEGTDAAELALKARRREAARFRLSGPVENGVWRVESAFPPVSGAQLKAALEILQLVDTPSTGWARDPAEAAALAELAAKSTGFIRTNPAQVRAHALQVSGAEITVTEERRPYLAMILFRHRLGDGPWDLRTHQQWDEKWLADYLEGVRLMNERARVLQEKYHVPRLEALLETPFATYYRVDFNQVLFAATEGATNVTPLIWKRVDGVHHLAENTFAEAITKVDAQFAAIGYRPLGDYQHGKADRREAYRVYGGKDDGTFALWGVVAGSFNMHWFFYSLLGTDFWVCTATFALPEGARRPTRSSNRGVGKISLTEQAAEHAKHVAEHADKGPAHPGPGSMEEFLPLIDRFNSALGK